VLSSVGAKEAKRGSADEVALIVECIVHAASKVKRAIDLSVEKYCSAPAMLAKIAMIAHDLVAITRPHKR
jgi:putative redox protein